MATAAAFTLTKDLPLSSDIVLSCWCPTMDLCAVVYSDGQLHLHRMDWQQLWAASPEVRAVCGRGSLPAIMLPACTQPSPCACSSTLQTPGHTPAPCLATPPRPR